MFMESIACRLKFSNSRNFLNRLHSVAKHPASYAVASGVRNSELKKKKKKNSRCRSIYIIGRSSHLDRTISSTYLPSAISNFFFFFFLFKNKESHNFASKCVSTFRSLRFVNRLTLCKRIVVINSC